MKYTILFLMFVVLLVSSCAVQETVIADESLELSSDVNVVDNSETTSTVQMVVESTTRSDIISVSELNSKRLDCRSDKDCYNSMVTRDVSKFYNYECVTDRMSEGKGICNFY